VGLFCNIKDYSPQSRKERKGKTKEKYSHTRQTAFRAGIFTDKR